MVRSERVDGVRVETAAREEAAQQPRVLDARVPTGETKQHQPELGVVVVGPRHEVRDFVEKETDPRP